MDEQTKQLMIKEHIKSFGVTKCPPRICESSWFSPWNRTDIMRKIKQDEPNTSLVSLPHTPSVQDLTYSNQAGKAAGVQAPSRVHTSTEIIQVWQRT